MHWYAIYTQSRHEQKVNDRMLKKKIETFLPLIEKWSRRKDRRKRIHLPLFPGYLF
ncbi:MAG: antitermination protein NusG, partial [Deltaproteobacteria bacterium]|nr:antitermination protein NusG [Deltaproteobacteria bacterium]